MQRTLWVDYARGIAMIGVMVVHLSAFPNELIKWIYTWLIPLFFFVAGYVNNISRQGSFTVYIKHQTRRLIIPYICFNCINYIYWICIGRNFGISIDNNIEVWHPLIGILYGNASWLTHAVPLWFIPCLLTTETLFFLIRKLSTRKQRLITVITTLSIGFLLYTALPNQLPWSFAQAFTMLTFYLFGNLSKTINIKNTANLSLLSLVFITTVLSITFLPILSIANVAYNTLGNYWFFLMTSFIGITSITLSMILIERKFHNIKLLAFLGQNTLFIMSCHLILYACIKGFTCFILKLPLDIYHNIYVNILLVCSTILISIPFIIGANKYTPWLVGKK